jgi:hypothetical protein
MARWLPRLYRRGKQGTKTMIRRVGEAIRPGMRYRQKNRRLCHPAPRRRAPPDPSGSARARVPAARRWDRPGRKPRCRAAPRGVRGNRLAHRRDDPARSLPALHLHARIRTLGREAVPCLSWPSGPAARAAVGTRSHRPLDAGEARRPRGAWQRGRPPLRLTPFASAEPGQLPNSRASRRTRRPAGPADPNDGRVPSSAPRETRARASAWRRAKRASPSSPNSSPSGAGHSVMPSDSARSRSPGSSRRVERRSTDAPGIESHREPRPRRAAPPRPSGALDRRIGVARLHHAYPPRPQIAVGEEHGEVEFRLHLRQHQLVEARADLFGGAWCRARARRSSARCSVRARRHSEAGDRTGSSAEAMP